MRSSVDLDIIVGVGSDDFLAVLEPLDLQTFLRQLAFQNQFDVNLIGLDVRQLLCEPDLFDCAQKIDTRPRKSFTPVKLLLGTEQI